MPSNAPPANGNSQIIKHRPSHANAHSPAAVHENNVKETALLALHCENGGARGTTNHVITFKNGDHSLENPADAV